MKPSRRLFTSLVAILISAMLPGGISMLADNTLRGKKLRITSATRDAVNGIKVSPVAPTDTLPASIPAGHTRMLRLATWDTQHSYYYHRGQKPRTANVTPYDITCHVDFMVLDSLSLESL